MLKIKGNTLICPKCKKPLKENAENLACPICLRNYSINKGIIEIDKPDERDYGLCPSTRKVGIKESFIIKTLRTISTTFSLSAQRERFYIEIFKKYIRDDHSELILDAGCGGGREILTSWGHHVTGLDLNIKSLYNASEIYNMCVCASIFDIPFPDNHFDFINCADVMGHFPSQQKDSIWKELQRVLRPGGKIAALVELDSNCPWWLFAKKYPDLFDKYFKSAFGHIGMEKHDDVLLRAKIAGFRLLFEGHVAGLPTTGDFVTWFDNEYKKHSFFIKIMMPIARFMNLYLPLRLSSDCILGIMSGFYKSRFLPDQSICGMYLFEKA
jgi:SAM-dependent methyltransferase